MEERPIECTSCKRKANIVYKEIVDNKTTITKMCFECPCLLHKIASPVEKVGPIPEEDGKQITCAACHTSLQSLLMGEGLGCPKCYAVFEEVLVKELSSGGSIPISPDTLMTKGKKIPLHLGKTPEKGVKYNFSKKLESLHLALSEALQLENYERAANIRDQIKTLMDESNGKERKAS